MKVKRFLETYHYGVEQSGAVGVLINGGSVGQPGDFFYELEWSTIGGKGGQGRYPLFWEVGKGKHKRQKMSSTGKFPGSHF